MQPGHIRLHHHWQHNNLPEGFNIDDHQWWSSFFCYFCALIMKWILTIFGCISLGLGVLGIFLPILPTTPLLLLAAALFLRSNRGLYDWLLNHPKLGPYIQNFMIHKSIPLRIKVLSVSLVWLTLLNCAIFVAEHWVFRLFFILLAAAITVHILSYKTL